MINPSMFRTKIIFPWMILSSPIWNPTLKIYIYILASHNSIINKLGLTFIGPLCRTGIQVKYSVFLLCVFVYICVLLHILCTIRDKGTKSHMGTQNDCPWLVNWLPEEFVPEEFVSDRAPNMALSTISLATLSSTLQTVLVCVRVVSSQLNPFTNCAPQIVRGTADMTTKLTLGALVVQNQVAYLVNSDKGTPSKYVSKGGLESASSAANIDSLAFMVNSDRRNPSILYDGIQRFCICVIWPTKRTSP